VGAAVSTMNPVTVHFYERDVVAFRMIDTLDGDSARGEYGGPFPGVVRPALEWETEVITGDADRATAGAELHEVSK
jgi:lipopolysaccharide transport system ATP-binding protein